MRRRPLPASSAPFVTVVMVTIPGSDCWTVGGRPAALGSSATCPSLPRLMTALPRGRVPTGLTGPFGHG